MKATGIVRRIDDLGRYVIAKEIRKRLDMHEGDSLEAYIEDDAVVLKKYQPGCIFCDSVSNLTEFRGRTICLECSAEIGKI